MDVEYNSMPAATLDVDPTEEERRRREAAAFGTRMPAAAVTPGVASERRSDTSSGATMPPAGSVGETRADASAPAPRPLSQPDASGWRHGVDVAADAAASRPAMPPAFVGPRDQTPPEIGAGGPTMPAARIEDMPMPAPALGAPSGNGPTAPTAVKPGTMPPANVGPAMKAYEDLAGQQRPELHGWKKFLDVLSQVSPIGRTVERNIPGSPGNYDVNLARAAMKATGEQNIQKGQQANESAAAAAQFNTPEKRRAYMAEHPDEFKGVSDFEKNDFILAGKFPQHEPAKPKEPQDKKVDEGFNAKGERVTVFQRPDGSRYNSVNADIVQKPPEDAGKLAADVEAQVGPRPTTPQYGGKTYPSVAEAQKQWGKDAERIINEKAAAGANARGASYGRNRPVEVLDTWNGNRPIRVSAGEQEDNPGRYINQSGGRQAIAGKVTLDDVEGALNNLKATTAVLDAGTMNRAAIAAVLADPNSTTKNFMQSAAAGTLSPQEQDYVIDLLTAREVIAGLRKAGNLGTATDSRVAAMLKTLPSAETPSSAYANKQIDSALGTVKRLRPGILGTEAQGKPSEGKGGFSRPKPNVVVEH